MDRFRNKYRIPSARASWWDYSKNALYFITICTQNREHYFGQISDDKMLLSETGFIAQQCWEEIPLHFPFVQLADFVVMPNHIHGIILIDKSSDDLSSSPSSTVYNQFGVQSRNLPSVIRGYKAGVTTRARLIDSSFAWQARFHDHIIRNNDSCNRIVEYIINNPASWEKDKFYLL